MPGERAKNGLSLAHLVPLSAPARELLRVRLPADQGEAQRVLAKTRITGALALHCL